MESALGQTGLELPYDSASRRVRLRYLAAEQLDHGRLASRLGRRNGRRATRFGLFAYRSACGSVLRRSETWKQSVFLVHRGAGCCDGENSLVFPIDASRRLGLRRRSLPFYDGRGSGWKKDPGGYRRIKTGAHVLPQTRDWAI